MTHDLSSFVALTRTCPESVAGLVLLCNGGKHFVMCLDSILGMISLIVGDAFFVVQEILSSICIFSGIISHGVHYQK